MNNDENLNPNNFLYIFITILQSYYKTNKFNFLELEKFIYKYKKENNDRLVKSFHFEKDNIGNFYSSNLRTSLSDALENGFLFITDYNNLDISINPDLPNYNMLDLYSDVIGEMKIFIKEYLIALDNIENQAEIKEYEADRTIFEMTHKFSK